MRRGDLLASALAAGALAASVLIWGEVVNARASRRNLGNSALDTGSGEVVVVLGYGNRGSRANAVNRWRVRAGIRSLDPSRGPATLVLSGGAVHGAASEAELMARYARDGLGYAGALVVEPDSTTTWENVRNVIPLIEHADRIKIVSNSVHAEIGRLYLRRQRPDLAERLVRGADYRAGEQLLLKPVTAWAGLRHLRRLRRDPSLAARPRHPEPFAARPARSPCGRGGRR